MPTATSTPTIARPVTTVPRRPTICQVLHCLSVGGAELLAADLVRSLKDRYRFVFACLDELGPLGGALVDEGFPVQVLHRHPGIDLGCARRLSTFLRKERVDLVHAHQYTCFFQASIARGLFGKTPILFTEHGRHYPDARHWKHIVANRFLTRSRDRIVGVGEAVRESLIVNEGFAAQRVGVVYNGVNLGPFAAYAPTVRSDGSTAAGTDERRLQVRSAVRREIGVGDGPLILQIARLNALKDHPTALRTIERVARVVPDARLVLVGDGEERRRIEQIVLDRQLDKSVILLGTRRDIPRLLAAADIFLLSSVTEGIPLTLIEAMAAGVPIVSTDVGGIREMIQPNVTGCLAPAGDDAALAQHLVRLIQSPAERAKLISTARQLAFDRFSQERMNEEYRRIYEEMLHG